MSEANGKITVLCVDDHPIVRDGLTGIINLQKDMLMAGCASTAEEALQLFTTLRPDVTIVDLRLSDKSGCEVIRNIIAVSPRARIVVLTSFEGDADMEQALAAGASGYVVKGMVREELLSAIRNVHAGKRHIPPAVASTLADHLGMEKLTHREMDVLREMSSGKRNKEIAGALFIAEDTVKMHVKSILMKLGVNDRTGAVTVALRRGILHL